MFEIFDCKTGEVIALAEEPRYVYKSPKTGVWIRCDEQTAEAVVTDNARYELGAEVKIRKADAAKRLAELAKSAETFEEFKPRFEDLVDAVIDLIDWRWQH